ncbi:MAG: hypothetical protein WA231_21060 [Methylocella sp.]
MFKKKPKPDDLAARRSDLSTRLSAAGDRLQTLRAEAVNVATGNPDQLAGLSEQVTKTEFEIGALRAAIGKADQDIAAAEEFVHLTADRLQREATAKELHALAVNLEQAVAPVPEVLEGLRVAIGASLPIIGQNGLADLLGNLTTEVPAAVELFVSELRARADQTLAGTAPPTMPAPFVPVIVEETPKMPTTTIFSLERLYWLDERGQRQNCGPFQIHGLPTEAANIALKRGLAILPDSDRYRQIRELARTVGLPHLIDPMKTYDLDRHPNTTSVFSYGGKKLRDEPGKFEAMPAKPPRNVEIDVMLPK